MKKVLVGMVLALAAVLAPAAVANAKPHVGVKLPLVPLQKAQLGSSGKSLSLVYGSGAISNAAAAGQTSDATAKTVAKLGRLTGYELDYGDPYTGAPGVTAVTTSVEKYKTPADAKKGLAFWRKEYAELSGLAKTALSVENGMLKVAAVGGARFADLTSYRAANIAPVSTLDERFTEGDYVLQVMVAAGSPAATKSLAAKLAKSLDVRIRLAEAGKLKASSAKLPAKPKAGAPAGGPDLSTLALQTTDFSGTAQVADHGYSASPPAVSDYSLLMLPAGPFAAVDQEVEWYANANEASFWSDWDNTQALSAKGNQALDLSSVGYGATGVFSTGSHGSVAQIVLSAGNLEEFIFGIGQGAVATSDVTNLANAAAAKLRAAGISG